MPGRGRVDHDPLRDALGILGRESVADHVADVVRHEIGVVELQRVHHRGDVGGLPGLLVSALRMGREAHAAEIGNHNGMAGPKRRGDRRPHVTRVAEAVQEDDRRPPAADPDMDRRAVGLDVLGLKLWRKLSDRQVQPSRLGLCDRRTAGIDDDRV